MVVMRTGDVRQGLFDGDWSGAAADSNRFAAVRISGRSGSPGGHKEDALLLAAATASGKETYWMQYQLQRATVQDGDQRLRENSSGQALVAPPGPLQPLSATRGTAHGVALRHTREVQAVTALLLEGSATTFVGSIDAAGRAGVTAFPMVGGAAGGHESGGKEAEDVTVEGGAEGGRGAKRRRVRGSGDGGGTSSSSSSAAAAATWWMEPQRDSLGRGMDGWAGLALSHSHVGGGGGASGLGGLSVATAHCWSKRLSFYSEGAPTPHRTVCTYHHPADLCFVDAAAQPGGTPAPGGDDGGGVGQLVAVAENHHLSIWDARVAEHGGCVQRLFQTHGEDRCVHLYDVKTWRPRCRWSHALKYPVANLGLSRLPATADHAHAGGQHRCYTTDRGTELRSVFMDPASGAKPKLTKGFMGDAPWVGLAVGDGFAAALTRKGTLYALADY